ncbi:hypothetical protein NM3139_0716 [Neisseria meningitidis NM3139]|nr:hypothetical protein NM3139_2025 [Neisseria meningitidis NM3139]EQD02787.1 hypothetical protein NM3139_1963 [Neisseria meningitidis NM3139]EQD05482.1 hypothetical protein NM3139_0716 [Neisseria meningitidis NM3139]
MNIIGLDISKDTIDATLHKQTEVSITLNLRIMMMD